MTRANMIEKVLGAMLSKGLRSLTEIANEVGMGHNPSKLEGLLRQHPEHFRYDRNDRKWYPSESDA